MSNLNIQKTWQGFKALCLSTMMLLASTWTLAQVSGYSFTPSAGTYTEITGGTIVAQTTSATAPASLDDNVYTIAIPFTFTFNGANFTSLFANTNGQIQFGGAGSGTNSSPISGTTAMTGAVSAIGNDARGYTVINGTRTAASATITAVANTNGIRVGCLVTGTGIPAGATVVSKTPTEVTISAPATLAGTSALTYLAGDIRTELTGTAPNQVFTIQWENFQRFGVTATLYDFQIKLYETTNVVQIVYGNTLSTAQTAQVGLRGSANTDFNNRTSTTSWAASAAGTLNNNTMTLNATVFPAVGQTYSWTPPACPAPGGITLTQLSTTSANISWTGTPNVIIEWGPNGYAPGTGATQGATAIGSVSTSTSPYTITGLTSTDDVYIRRDCGAGAYSSNTFRDFLVIVGDEAITAQTIDCTNNTGLGYAAGTTGFTAGATPSGGVCVTTGGLTVGSPSRWFVYSGTNNLVTIEICNAVWDTRLSVYTGSPSGALTCVTGNDDFCGTNGWRSQVTFNGFTGTNYYVLVHGFGTGSGATATLNIGCAFLCVPVATNDECATPAALPLNTVVSTNNECATASSQASQSCGTTFGTLSDIWMDFTAGAVALHELTISSALSAAPQAGGPHRYMLYTGCADANYVAGSCTLIDPSTAGANSLTLTPGQNYKLRITVSSNDVGNYILGNMNVRIQAITCPKPTVLGATNITINSADLTWTKNSTAADWEVEYGLSGFTPTGVANLTGSYPTVATATGLATFTAHQFYVRDNCGGGDFSTWAGPFTFTTLATCPAPTALGTANLTSTSTNLAWTQNSSAANWEVRWGLAGAAPATANLTGAYPTAAALSGLSTSTSYEFYVRDNCGAGDFSAWAGPFTFSTLIVGDVCLDAQPINCAMLGAGLAGSTVGATLDNDYINCGAGGTAPQRGVWYKYVGNDQEVTLTTCVTSPTFDSRLTVFTGTCGALTCVTGNDDMGALCSSSTLMSRVQFNAFLGSDYYIFVHTFSTSTTSAFTLSGSCDVICIPTPSNDECSAATALTVAGSCIGTAGTTNCANPTIGGVNNPTCLSTFGTYNDVWYTFVASDINHDLRITLGTAVNTTVQIYNTAGCLSTDLNPNQVGCLTYPTVPSGNDVQLTGLVINNTYKVRVASTANSEGTFDICVWENPCPFPTGFASSNITTTTADLTWNENGTATAWDIYYDLQGGAAPTGSTTPTMDNVGTTTATLTGLTAETCYSVWLRSDNAGASCQSVWVGPLTVCTNALPPDCATGEVLLCNINKVVTTAAGNGAWNIGNDSGGPFGTPGKERVYKYTATGTGNHFISVSAATGGFYDYFWKLQSAGCSSTGWNYIDDMAGAGVSAAFSLNSGDQIYIAVDKEGTTAGTQTFKVLCPTPAPINNEPAGALVINPSGNGFPLCSTISGDLTYATDSPAETYAAGKDVWYQFVALSSSISATQTGIVADDVLHLFNSSLVSLDVEDEGFSNADTEILNYTGLVPGQTYYLCVDAWGANNGGAFGLCLKHLVASSCDNGPGAYPMCSNFKPDYTGANNYTFNFTPTSYVGLTTTGSSTGQIALSTPSLALQYGATYNVTVDGTFNLVNGVGDPEVLTVVGTIVCAISIPAHADVQVKATQWCPATLLKGSILQGKPFVCGVLNYTVEATELNACAGSTIGLPFTGTTTGSSASIALANINTGGSIQGGGKWYSIRYRPNFTYGPGSFGTARVIFVGGSVSDTEVAGANNAEERTAIEVEANLYPNPNTGDMVNLNIANIDVDNVFVNITDMQGRIVYTNRYTVDGSLNTIVTFAQPLANGVYNVQFIIGNEILNEKLMVQK
jgi:hypothetical protein